MKEALALRTPRAVNHARVTLVAGFTTIRDLDTEARYADIGLKQAVEQGIVAGPRMLVATRALVATGAYVPKNAGPEFAGRGGRGGRARPRCLPILSRSRMTTAAIAAVRAIRLVMKGGKIVRED